MSQAAKVLRNTLVRLLIIQVLLIAGAAVLYLVLKGAPGMLAALYGGVIALLGTGISGWRLLRATLAESAQRGVTELYIGAGLRFVVTLGLMAVGMGLLRLDPLAIIVGFAVAQLGYLFNSVRTDVGMREH